MLAVGYEVCTYAELLCIVTLLAYMYTCCIFQFDLWCSVIQTSCMNAVSAGNKAILLEVSFVLCTHTLQLHVLYTKVYSYIHQQYYEEYQILVCYYSHADLQNILMGS